MKHEPFTQVHLHALIKVHGVVTRRSGVFPQLKLVKYCCNVSRFVVFVSGTLDVGHLHRRMSPARSTGESKTEALVTEITIRLNFFLACGAFPRFRRSTNIASGHFNN